MADDRYSTLKEKALQCLNEAKLATDKTQKQNLLAELVEIVFNREPVLVTEFLPYMLELHTERLTVVRKFVLNVIEIAAKRLQRLPSQVLETLIYLLQYEDTPSLKKNIVLSATTVFRKGLMQIAETEPNQINQARNLWKDLMTLKGGVLSNINSDNVALQTQTIKFIEAIILSYSTPDTPLATRDHFTLLNIPQYHPLLIPSELRQEGESYVGLLAAKLFQCNSTTAIVIINSFASIVKQRVAFGAVVLSQLVKFAKQLPPGLTEAQMKSLQHALRAAFVSQFKLQFLGEFREVLYEGLVAIGARDQADSLKRQFPTEPSGSGKRQRSDSGNVPSKRGRIEPKQEGPSTATSSLTPEQWSLLTNGPTPPLNPANMTPDLLVNFLLKTLLSLGNPPPGVAVSSEPVTPLPPSSARFDPRRDPRLARLDKTASRAPEPVPEPTPDYPTQVSAPTPAPVPTPTPASVPVIAPTPAPPVSRVPKAPPKLLTTIELSEYQVEALGDQAFDRIVSSEAGIKRSGKLDLRMRLLSKLAFFKDADGSSARQLVTHIRENIPERLNLAITWLYNEFLNEVNILKSEENEVKDSRYTRILLDLMHNIFDSQTTRRDELLTTFLVECPYLPSEPLEEVKGFCEKQVAALGFSILHKLIIRRPATRDRCLTIVLDFTSHEDEQIRTLAIRLVAKKLFGEKYLIGPIEQYATRQLYNLIELCNSKIRASEENTTTPMEIDGKEKEEGKDEKEEEVTNKEKEEDKEKEEGGTVGEKEEEGTNKEVEGDVPEEEIRRKLLLYIALCTKKHDLISGMMDAYVKAPTNVKTVIHKQVVPLIRSIGSTPQLLHVINSLQPGSEAFVLHVLHILTENDAPSPALINIVKNLYERKVQGNIRFLLPILNGLTKDEVIMLLPKIIVLKRNLIEAAIQRILTQTPSPLTPQELLVQLHMAEFRGDPDVTLRKMIEAIQICLNNQNIFTEKVMGVVLQRLFDEAQLPSLFMRTVIQAITIYPKLANFVLNILNRLISKQVWNDKVLWPGFITCCKMTQPQSFSILVQLPRPQLEDALTRAPDLREPLIQHSKRNPVNIPRSSLQLLQELQDAATSSSTPASTSS